MGGAAMAGSSLIRSFVSLAVFAALAAPPARADGKETQAAEGVDRLIDGVLTRCSAIKTGTFYFKYGSLWADPAKPKPWDWAPEDDRSVFLTVAGDEWVVRWPKAANTVMHRKGYYTDQFEIIRLNDVNKPIPESAFEVSLPAGTEIADYRTNNDGEFLKAKQPFLLSKVDELTGKPRVGNEGTPKRP
jgi:hypothetical protein